MKKIGILTFHKSINYGAYMQCYSLSKRIQNDFPEAKVEVINYATIRVFENYDYSLPVYLFGSKRDRENRSLLTNIIVAAKGIMRHIMNPKLRTQLLQRTEAFQKSWSKLPLSDSELITDDCEAFFKSIKDEYDIVVVGSDCVWEYTIYPFPNAYFLHDDIGTPKFSYAASSDRIHPDMLDDYKTGYINEALSSFEYIGIRDIATQNLINSFNENLCLHHNCDPTVFLDIDALDVSLIRVKKILHEAGIDLDKPIIGVMGDDSVGKLVRDIFGDKYKIVAIYAYTRYADIYMYDLSPFEWAKVFSLFSVTFTRYFHGTIFSMKNGTPPITIDYWNMVDESHITKIKDLYLRLGIKEHYFTGHQNYTKKEMEAIKISAEKFMENPDSDILKEALKQEAKQYESFYHALAECIKD